jgi:predicted phage replisome organizer
MPENGKYYWLKLKRDFFKRHDIRIIEEMPNGKDYILFYLKLLLESVDHEGSLRFSDTIPYNEQMLSVVTNTNIDIVRSAMKLFIELNMMSIYDDQTIFMNEVDKLIGSETKWAEKKRLQRAKGDNVPELSSNCPTEIEKEKEIEKDKEKEFHSFTLSGERNVDVCSKEDRESAKLTYMGGTLGQNILLISDEQFDDLCDRMSLDELHKYIDIVVECEKNGKRFKKKSHYQAILDMVEKDRRIK